jgi:hypothetical protein
VIEVSNKAYDILKIVSLIIAPAVVFLTALVDIWGIPYGSQIVATLAAVDVLLGALVTIFKNMYDKSQKGEENAE